jgi:hypothetical protein
VESSEAGDAPDAASPENADNAENAETVAEAEPAADPPGETAADPPGETAEPVEEPAAEAPEAPAAEAPAAEEPTAGAPVEPAPEPAPEAPEAPEAPAAEESAAPGAEAPAEEAPAEEAPEEPAEEAPQAPAGDAPAEQAPEAGAPAEEAPQAPAEEPAAAAPEGDTDGSARSRQVKECLITQFVDFGSGETVLDTDALSPDSGAFVEQALTKEDLTDTERDRLLATVWYYGEEEQKTAATDDCAQANELDKAEVEAVLAEVADLIAALVQEANAAVTEGMDEVSQAVRDAELTGQSEIDPVDAAEWRELWESLPWSVPAEDVAAQDAGAEDAAAGS